MTILINAIELNKKKQPHFYIFLKLIFARIIIQNTSINFIILENSETSFEFKFNNCNQILLPTNSYFLKISYLKNLKISKLINDSKSDFIINFGGSGISSKLKQILIIENCFFSLLKSNQTQINSNTH